MMDFKIALAAVLTNGDLAATLLYHTAAAPRFCYCPRTAHAIAIMARKFRNRGFENLALEYTQHRAKKD
ncbi:MAG: hypothetical protein AAF922_04435 [Pseudomonadota bacterium]